MSTEDERLRLDYKRHSLRGTVPAWAARILGIVTGVVVLVLAFMFSVIVFAALAVAGLLGWGYVWWKTRKLRKQWREHPPGGHVIEGEAMRDERFEDGPRR